MTPIRSATLAVLCLLSICHAALAESEEEAIRKTFDDYRAAVLANDGRAAEHLLSKGTIDYYGQMRELALRASSEALQSQALVGQMQVLLLRIRMDPAQLEAMAGSELLIHSVEQGWIGKEGIARAQLGRLSIEDSTAVAHAEIGGQDFGPAFYFVKKGGGVWRFDLLPTLDSSNGSLEATAEQRGISGRELILMLVEATVGHEVDGGVWNPLLPAPEQAE
jgi:hypothetical protein